MSSRDCSRSRSPRPWTDRSEPRNPRQYHTSRESTRRCCAPPWRPEQRILCRALLGNDYLAPFAFDHGLVAQPVSGRIKSSHMINTFILFVYLFSFRTARFVNNCYHFSSSQLIPFLIEREFFRGWGIPKGT